MNLPMTAMAGNSISTSYYRQEIGTVVALEDVGTTGGTAYTGLRSAQQAGALGVEGQFTWQRTKKLSVFDAADMPYYAVINEPLQTYTPEQCRAEGYCAQGWQLISRL